jgi:O-antigen/teichoic acid export membrane protein
LGPIGIERSPQAMAKKQNGDGGLGLIIVVLAVLGAAIFYWRSCISNFVRPAHRKIFPLLMKKSINYRSSSDI